MTQPAASPEPDRNDPALAVAMRWSVGLLVAASVVVVAGFMATDALSGDRIQRWGGPSAQPVARLGIPSEESVRIERLATYALYYEQEAPSTGIPRELEVAIRSEEGELDLSVPSQVTATVIDGRSYVKFKETRVPRSGAYTVQVTRPGAATLSELDDDRIVLDRVDGAAETMAVLLGLTPAALGMSLAAGLGAAALWVRHRALRAWRLTHLADREGTPRVR